MSKEKEVPQIEKKIVVTFDICSSTSIIEDLHKTENIIKWSDFLMWINRYLKIKSEELDFSIYKFTGDGWLLLFDYNYPIDDLINFLQDFCKLFKMRYERMVENFLETPPQIYGLTFGIDRGSLVKIIMNNEIEYVGRAINVACRLQGAIKDKDKSPQYKALMTKPLYQNIHHLLHNLKHIEVKRKLRNIAGGEEIQCVKMSLFL